MDGVDDPDRLGEGISVICFNYDRCIEFYLAEAISAAYDIAYEDAAEIVQSINIIHPYGTLGELPSKGKEVGEGILPFGAPLDHDIEWMKIAAENIRTYTEQQHDPKMVNSIHEAVGESGILVFLGFGFNNQNLDLLRVVHLPRYPNVLPERNIYSSGFGIAQQVDDTIKRRIMHLLWDGKLRHQRNIGRVHVEYGQSCSQLFQTHQMNLSSFTRSYFSAKADFHVLERVTVSSTED